MKIPSLRTIYLLLNYSTNTSLEKTLYILLAFFDEMQLIICCWIKLRKFAVE